MCVSWLASRIASTNTISLSFTSSQILLASTYSSVLTTVSASISTRVTHVTQMLLGITGVTTDTSEISYSTLALQSEVSYRSLSISDQLVTTVPL